ncbi:protein BLISTER-like isoform X1 [Gossypium arboreum]|uniref:protein BLISTER-like isoform X1 n=1 Tax=Gossypium arboreum TaxID=29729 RepID=UPI00081956E4|nr:protein BLISTER-like isoform X1 [Gossypium arboreum]
MASAQVLPSSRKQEHLEAGKHRLEEFRKKKAADRAKKAASTTQPHASDVILNDKHLLETEDGRVTDFDGAGTSNGPNPSYVKIINDNNKINDVSDESQQTYSKNMLATPSVLVNDNYSYSTEVQKHSKSQENEKYGASWNGGLFNDRLQTQHLSNDFQDTKSKEDDGSMKASAVVNLFSSEDFVTKISPQNSLQSKASDSSLLGSALEVGQSLQGSAEFREPMSSEPVERTFSSYSSGFPSVPGPSAWTFGSSEFSFDAKSSTSYMPLQSATNDTSSRKSSPSFLDSLNLSKAPSGSLFQHNEPTKYAFPSHSSQFNSMNAIRSSPLDKPSMESETMGTFSEQKSPVFPSASEFPGHFAVPAKSNGDLLRLNENISEKKHEYYSAKQNEDFAALEQHIEDLTQEKFSLQRALEPSRMLAESLAAENSSLTDSYNQQRSVVNQLKYDMEKLQEEIKAQLAELESLKMEYTNARLECNAADERAKILASEVISLEEKALSLRSNELKLERQLENSDAEISFFKKKMSSIEKERQDFESTIEALLEEKRVLQSKLRKASVSGKPFNVTKNPASKDMSTSTEDLISIDAATDDRENISNDASSLSLLPEDGQFEAASVYIPPDQMRMIQNINCLISELTLEKEELAQAFSSELSQSLRLKELNNELSRKLEAQTQRLELLSAQSMAGEHIPVRQYESKMMHDNTPYADEGDEVVERVLGWIMKLFPGGPSRWRTNMRLSY